MSLVSVIEVVTVMPAPLRFPMARIAASNEPFPLMRSFTSGVEPSILTWACSSPALARSSAIPRSTSSPLVLIATAMPYSDAYPTTSASPRLPRSVGSPPSR